MHQITVTHEFCAAHTLTIAGAPEPTHGHNFVTRATITGEKLDADGLLCDFHALHAVLIDVCAPLANQNLNTVPPFHALNPSAEHLAQHIADRLAERLDESLAPNARVHSVSITEAPGCVATYTRD